MSGIQNVSNLSFKGNYIIPFNQIKDSSTMRAIGSETVKYANPKNMMQRPDGIVVKIDDDNKAREFEAVIAKYGVNIKKYDGQFNPNDLELNSYRFLVTKLYPYETQQKIDAYKAMDEQQKRKEYLETYKKFKNSQHSVEYMSNRFSPKLKPTNKPIIKYTTKDGEHYMARKVELENCYVCMAVSNEKNPAQATLLNKEEFQKLFISTVKQMPVRPSFKGNDLKKATGQFADKNFKVECSEGLTNRRMSGVVDNLNFDIKHDGKLFKSDTITGNIGNKALNLKVKEGLSKHTIAGTIGDAPVDLKVIDTWSGYGIKGTFKNRDIDIKLKTKLNGYSLESDNMSLQVKSNWLFGNGVKVKGSYNDDPDLIPILMDMVYGIKEEELMFALVI